jgi:hypothetical protein
MRNLSVPRVNDIMGRGVHKWLNSGEIADLDNPQLQLLRHEADARDDQLRRMVRNGGPRGLIQDVAVLKMAIDQRLQWRQKADDAMAN